METLRDALLVVLAVSWSGLGLTAEVSDVAVTFDIERQSLRQALTEFAKQTGLQVMLREEDVEAGRETARSVKGEFSPREALRQLLENTNLKYEFVTNRMVRISAEERSARATAREVNLHGLELAQSGASSPASTSSEYSPSPADVADRNGGGEELQEIVVTAQKREERLQDVPISMSVLSGADLDSSTAEGITESLNRVPGVATTVTSQGGGTQLSVRGVTAGAPLFAGSSPVSYYLDSVPFGFVRQAIVPDANAYDLERVEALRGPQGTLYGASAQNGVVRILTKDANPNSFEWKARTSASSTERGGENYRGDLAINVPIVEGKLAARAVAGYQSLSGWIDAPTNENVNDAELRNVRLKVKAQPTEQLSFDVSAWLSRSDLGGPSTSDDHDKRTNLLDERLSSDYDVYGLKVEYEFAAFSLASMTSYLEFANDGSQDLLPLFLFDIPLFTALDSRILSQEVILNSRLNESWRWTAGAMFRDGEDRLVQDIPPGLFAIDFTQTSKSTAVFGELTRVLAGGKLELTAGLRYFTDDVGDFENALTSGATGPLIQRDDRFDALTPRAVLAWHPSAQLTVYGSYAEGFRSGFNQWALVTRTAPTFPSVKPDTIKNYELGAKGNLLGGRVRFDTALYYIDWLDVQQVLTVNVGSVPVTAVVNGESASGVGFDFGLTVHPADGLELAFNFNWNDLQMDGDVFDAGALLFANGDRLNLSPEMVVGGSVGYNFSLGDGGFSGRLSGSANYISEQDQRSIFGGVQATGRGEPTLIARTSFSIDAPDHWSATLFVDNINDTRNSVTRFPLEFPEWDSRVRPRTIGLQVEYRY